MKIDNSVSVEKFMKAENGKGRVSKLEPLSDDILLLRSNNYTQKQIMAFLAMNEVEVSQTALNNFIRVRQSSERVKASGQSGAKLKVSAVEFMEQETGAGRVSKLEPFKDDILLLRNNGYTQKQIVVFLAMNGVEVSQKTVSLFLAKHDREGYQPKETGKASAALEERAVLANDAEVMLPQTLRPSEEKPEKGELSEEERKEAERIRKLHKVRIGKNQFTWPPPEMDRDELY